MHIELSVEELKVLSDLNQTIGIDLHSIVSKGLRVVSLALILVGCLKSISYFIQSKKEYILEKMYRLSLLLSGILLGYMVFAYVIAYFWNRHRYLLSIIVIILVGVLSAFGYILIIKVILIESERVIVIIMAYMLYPCKNTKMYCLMVMYLIRQSHHALRYDVDNDVLSFIQNKQQEYTQEYTQQENVL